MPIYLEGMEETMYGFRRTSTLGYSMLYDPDYVRPAKHEGYDHYTAVTETDVPEIYMRVTKETRTAEAVIAALEADGAEQWGTMLVGGCRGICLSRSEGYAPEDAVVDYYVVQAADRVYLIETGYVWEIAEGIGQRMRYMVRSMTFADVPAAATLKITVRDKEVTDFTSAIGEMTSLHLDFEDGAAIPEVQWTVSADGVCELFQNSDSCDVFITGEGTVTVTATAGDLQASVIVRGIQEWK